MAPLAAGSTVYIIPVMMAPRSNAISHKGMNRRTMSE
jgi:hypothetical protein